MKIKTSTIRNYLEYITSMELEDVADPVADLSDYDEAIDAMAADATTDENLKTLRLAMASLIVEPQDRIEAFYGAGYPFTAEQLIEILTYAHNRVWPEREISNSSRTLPVEFV